MTSVQHVAGAALVWPALVQSSAHEAIRPGQISRLIHVCARGDVLPLLKRSSVTRYKRKASYFPTIHHNHDCLVRVCEEIREDNVRWVDTRWYATPTTLNSRILR